MILAGSRGPLVAWRQRYAAPPIGVSYLDPIVLTVQVMRPDGVAGPVWSTADGSITYEERTADTLRVVHVLRSDVDELPWIEMPRTRSREIANLPQHWTFLHTLTVNGAHLPVVPTCVDVYNDRRCYPNYSTT